MPFSSNPQFGRWPSDDDLADRPWRGADPIESRKPHEFVPVLRVDIATGRILLDRRGDPKSKWTG